MRIRTLWLLPMIAVLVLSLSTTVTAQVPVKKIVVFRDGVDEVAKLSAVRETGGNPTKSLGLVNATAAELTPASVAALTSRPQVVRIEDDKRMHEDVVDAPKSDAANRKSGGEKRTKSGTELVPWGVDRIDAPEAWGISRGAGVKVAVLDSGIDLSHPDLRVAGGVSEVHGVKSYNDDRGHGTHVAGIIAALDNQYGVVGVGPGVALYAVKVIDKQGVIWASDVIAGLEWSVKNKMRVANMSFGSSEDSQTVREAISRAYGAGIVLVASAGNSGPASNSVHYPALYPEVLAVSAIGSGGALATWSSNGPQVALAAPGVDVLSTYLGPRYATLSGTSMAAPHVAGVAALRLNLHPDETPSQVAAALKRSAERLPGLSPDQQGAGLVDARQAVTAR